MFLGKLKSYALLILSVITGALAFALKFMGARNKRLEHEAKTQRVKYEKVKEVMEKDIEIDWEYDKRTEELADEIKKKRTSSELSDPNRW